MDFTKYLPDMIRLAVKEMQGVTKDPSIKIDMDDWIKTDSKGKACGVCLGGAVLLNIIKDFSDIKCGIISPFDIPSLHHISVLDKIRLGHITCLDMYHELDFEFRCFHGHEFDLCFNRDYYSDKIEDGRDHIPFGIMLQMADDVEQWFLDMGYGDYVEENKDYDLSWLTENEIQELDNLDSSYYYQGVN